MKASVVIVDDELHAREGIRIRIGDFAEVEIVGECSSGAEAVSMIDRLHPDIVFLDIQMPEMNGFDVLRKITVDPLPAIIFVTAYDKYALRAFEYHAIDYLLKPINEERFREAVGKALSLIGHRSLETYAVKLKQMLDDYLGLAGGVGESTKKKKSAEHPDHLAIKSHENIIMLPVAEIDWVEAAGDYIYLHANSQKHIVRETLTAFEKKIDPKHFVRIHRSTIVNIDRVRNLRSNDHGDFEVFLKSGERLKLSRSYRENFQKVIGNSL